MNTVLLSILPLVIAGLVPATHRAECQAFEPVAPWVAGINPAMTNWGYVLKAAA